MMWKKVGSVTSSQKQELSSLQSHHHRNPFLRKETEKKRKLKSNMIHEEMENPLSGKTTVKQSRSKSINPRKMTVAYKDSDSSLMGQIHINFHSQEKKPKESSLHFKTTKQLKENVPIEKWRQAVVKLGEIKAEQSKLKDYVKQEVRALSSMFRETLQAYPKVKSKKTILLLREVKEFKVRMVDYQTQRERILKNHDLTLDSLL